MFTADIVNDTLLMLSALGSAGAGVICGWQFRAAQANRAIALAAEEAQLAALRKAEELAELAALDEADPTFTTTTDVKPVLFSDEATDDTDQPYADFFRDEPAGMSAAEVQEVAQRLIQFADRITSDVNEHDAELNEVNHSLHDAHVTPTVESVMAAVEKLVQSNERMQTQLRDSRDRIVEQARQIELAEIRANTDGLTRIMNRRALDQAIAKWTGDTPGAFALIDIDFFKKFNDQHGHRAGDEVLRSVASALQAMLSEHCKVARYGGEEFALLFTEHTLEEVVELVETARRKIGTQTMVFEGTSLQVTCSLGITRMLPGEHSAQWVQRADDGLYMAKKAGRDCAFCIDSTAPGKREEPYRLGLPHSSNAQDPASASELAVDQLFATADNDSMVLLEDRHRSINQAILDRLPDRDTLASSYRNLLARLGRAPVNLSIAAIRVDQPESLIASRGEGESTRLSLLVDVVQAACRAVDRVGYYDPQTLLLCVPGISPEEASLSFQNLRSVLSSQLQLQDPVLQLGISEVQPGDSFETLALRAIQNGQTQVIDPTSNQPAATLEIAADDSNTESKISWRAPRPQCAVSASNP